MNSPDSPPLKLHIGGKDIKDGWTLLNIMPGPGVDVLGSCTDLSMFASETVDEVYASHILEHLPPVQLGQSLREIYRILKPGAVLKGSVPDLEILCRLYIRYCKDLTDNISIMRMIYGGHMDEYDVHHFGFNEEILANMLFVGGFKKVSRVNFHHEFSDSSYYQYRDTYISLNFIAYK